MNNIRIMRILSVETDFATKSDFRFREYANLIFSVVPESDIVGISKIRFADNFSHHKCLKNSPACCIPDMQDKKSIIEINISNLLKKRIPRYLFDNYPEIAALFLSEFLTHEIGHHVHIFRRYGIKKKEHEKFANEYARAGYYNYLRLRRSEILFSYRRASWNIFRFDKDGRKKFSSARKELIRWMEENKNGICFP